MKADVMEGDVQETLTRLITYNRLNIDVEGFPTMDSVKLRARKTVTACGKKQSK